MVKVISEVFSSRLIAIVERLCEPVKFFLGCDCVSYSRITDTGGLFHISNSPSSTIEYWMQSLYQKNPFYQNPYGFQAGAYFLKEVDRCDYQAGLQYLEKRNIHLFMRFVVRQGNLMHHFIFGSKVGALPFNTIYANNQKKFKAFMDHFIENTKTFDFDKYSLSLPEVMGSLHTTEGIVAHASDEKAQNALFFKQLGIASPLSPREDECAHGLLMGLTAPQIARMLHLSPRTIEARILGMKNKLHAHSKRELVEKLRQLRACDLID